MRRGVVAGAFESVRTRHARKSADMLGAKEKTRSSAVAGKSPLSFICSTRRIKRRNRSPSRSARNRIRRRLPSGIRTAGDTIERQRSGGMIQAGAGFHQDRRCRIFVCPQHFLFAPITAFVHFGAEHDDQRRPDASLQLLLPVATGREVSGIVKSLQPAHRIDLMLQARALTAARRSSRG